MSDDPYTRNERRGDTFFSFLALLSVLGVVLALFGVGDFYLNVAAPWLLTVTGIGVWMLADTLWTRLRGRR